MSTCKYINISCIYVSGVYTAVILSMLYCDGIIGEGQGRKGAREQNIYTMRSGCARGRRQGVKGPKDGY